MFDGVDQGFLQGQLDAEYVVLVDAASLEKLFDLVLNPAALGDIAGDGDLGGNRRTDIAREFMVSARIRATERTSLTWAASLQPRRQTRKRTTRAWVTNALPLSPLSDRFSATRSGRARR